MGASQRRTRTNMGPDVRISLVVSAHSAALSTYYSPPPFLLFTCLAKREPSEWKKWHSKDSYLTKKRVSAFDR